MNPESSATLYINYMYHPYFFSDFSDILSSEISKIPFLDMYPGPWKHPLTILKCKCFHIWKCMLDPEPQWKITWVGSSTIGWYQVKWFPINSIDCAWFHLKNENGSKICRARLSRIPSPRVQWCQAHYFRKHSIWLYQTRFLGCIFPPVPTG